MKEMQDSQWQLWLLMERRLSHHMRPFPCDKSENFEQGWAGETEAGRVWEVWGSPVHGRVCHSRFSHRLCHWLLPKLLTRLFLSVQLHWGQLEMVLRAARMVWRAQPQPGRALSALGMLGIHPRIPCLQPEVPLVFLCSHRSQVDGLLLSFVLLSQGIGLPRVTVGAWPSPSLR